MKKNRRIEIIMGKTVNTGNFSSLKVQVGLSEDIPDDVDLDEKYEQLHEYVAEVLDDSIVNMLEDGE